MLIVLRVGGGCRRRRSDVAVLEAANDLLRHLPQDLWVELLLGHGRLLEGGVEGFADGLRLVQYRRWWWWPRRCSRACSVGQPNIGHLDRVVLRRQRGRRSDVEGASD